MSVLNNGEGFVFKFFPLFKTYTFHSLFTYILYIFRGFLKRQHRIKMLAKARKVEEELMEDQKILEELKSFAKKKEEEETHKVLEARTKQLEWLDGVSIISVI